MRWGDFRQSDNIEDRTGDGGGFGGGSFGGGGGIRLGLGGIVIAVIASLILGINPLQFLGMIAGDNGGYAPQPTPAPRTAPPGYGPPTAPRQTSSAPLSDERKMIGGILGDTEDVWTAVFRTQGRQYTPPVLVLFTGATQSDCGRASTAIGPFYCPGDRKLYLDTGFFRELAQRFGAPGDFAQAYVVAHEVGHHVQNLLGTMSQFDARSRGLGARERDALSVRLELQADCYAGVWGFYAAKRHLLDPGDLDQGLRAAAAVGDDNIQKMTRGTVVPESFTHGSSQQRSSWFKRGFDSGDIGHCDTFAGS
ncbi:MAG: neutral zinc metallopeptidase [Casimicrobiaceae bacterium]